MIFPGPKDQWITWSPTLKSIPASSFRMRRLCAGRKFLSFADISFDFSTRLVLGNSARDGPFRNNCFTGMFQQVFLVLGQGSPGQLCVQVAHDLAHAAVGPMIHAFFQLGLPLAG